MSLTETTRVWSQHTCEWPIALDYSNICGVTAHFKRNGFWYCGEHYDLYDLLESENEAVEGRADQYQRVAIEE
jgi:hypothetical protein